MSFEILLTDKPPVYEAIKFEGGTESAIEVMEWLGERFPYSVTYSPPRQQTRYGGIYECINITGNKDELQDWHVPPDTWIVRDPSIKSRLTMMNDESLLRTYDLV